MSITEMSPSEMFQDVYRQLGTFLEVGDDMFVEQGPTLVQYALDRPGFMRGLETERADDSYTRAKVMGEPDEHVVRYMEWPPEFSLLPHEHHGRPCFEVLVDGRLFLADMEATEVTDGEYKLTVTSTSVCGPGETAVVDPRDGSDIHAVYAPERTRSLHVYPDDSYYSVGYVPIDTMAEGDRYERKTFQVRDDD